MSASRFKTHKCRVCAFLAFQQIKQTKEKQNSSRPKRYYLFINFFLPQSCILSVYFQNEIQLLTSRCLWTKFVFLRFISISVGTANKWKIIYANELAMDHLQISFSEQKKIKQNKMQNEMKTRTETDWIDQLLNVRKEEINSKIKHVKQQARLHFNAFFFSFFACSQLRRIICRFLTSFFLLLRRFVAEISFLFFFSKQQQQLKLWNDRIWLILYLNLTKYYSLGAMSNAIT